MTPNTVIAKMPCGYDDFGQFSLSDLGLDTYHSLIASRIPDELAWYGDEIIGSVDWDGELDIEEIVEESSREMMERYPDDMYWEDTLC